MRKKIIIIYITLVTVPIIILYFISAQLFENTTRDHLKLLNTKNIVSMGGSLQNFLANSIEISMYPINESNLQKFLTASGKEPDYYNIFRAANNILLTLPFTTRGILGIYLLSQNGNTLNTDYIASGITQSDINQASNAEGYQVWEFETDKNGNKVLAICRLIRDYPNTNYKIGYIKIVLDTNEIGRILNVSEDIPGITYYIIDNSNHALFTSKSSPEFNRFYSSFNEDELIDNNASTKRIRYKGAEYFISGIKIKGTPYALYSISSEGVSFGIQPTILRMLSITTIILILTCTILAFILSKVIVNPLRELSKKMTSVSLEDFSVRLSIRGNDEISSLASKFNFMTEKLQILYNEVYAEKISQKQAQLSALLSQINPHFLYNTLDTIYWMSEMGDTKSVSKMVSSLSNMMRFTVMDDLSVTTSLHSELEYLQSYINIQKVRYSDSINFSISVDPTLADCQVLKMILQPLVENAIIHGITPHGSGNIEISIYLSENKLIYEVRNSGTCINIDETLKLLENASEGMRGFALKNVQDRIMIIYGNGYGISVHLENNYTVFTISQPIMREF